MSELRPISSFDSITQNALESRNSNENPAFANLLEDNESLINRFSPSYSVHTADIGKAVIQNVVDEVLWTKGGTFQGSSTECSTVDQAEHSPRSTVVGQRVTYWQNYLKQHARICEKLSKATGKNRCDLLLNKCEDFRKIQQCKRIIDISERLSPTRLLRREPDKLKEIPCLRDVYETLPKTERRQKPTITLTEMPRALLEEQGIEKCKISKSSWMNSKYLGQKLLDNQDKLRRVIQYYPESELQIIGKKIVSDELQAEESDEVVERFVEFNVADAWSKGKELSLEYVITIEGQDFDAEIKSKNDVNFCLTFEGYPFEEQIRTITVHNKGCKGVQIEWIRNRPRRFKFLKETGPIFPAFYFNKNPLTIPPGIEMKIDFIFCCKQPGIYTENWEMKLVPPFFTEKAKMTVSMFGHCRLDQDDRNAFYKINNDINYRAAKQIADEVLKDVTNSLVPELPRQHPYRSYFTQNEIFNLVNPSLNYSEACVEQLKDMYVELMQDNVHVPCKEWHFDLKQLKNAIISIPEEAKRKEYHAKFRNLVEEMKVNPVMFSPNYEDQKFLLVRKLLLMIGDSIEKTAQQLEDAILTTQLDLRFDEVLLTNAKRRRCTSIEDSNGSGYMDGDDDTKSVCVVKSEAIRKKKKEFFDQSLYVHVYSQFCIVVEQVAGIIEGIKDLR